MHVDTLAIARDLKETKLPPLQAEAIPAAIGRSVTEGTATKADVRVLEEQMTAMEARIGGKLESAKNQLFIWLDGVIFASVGVVVAVKL
ncbi:hypothetical protein [Sphingomonas sp.]|uniref:hypothetical protein n=1 Tax=Sphingomonas sp. TaxID=28214 RepID=UPI003CC5DE57